MVEASAASVGTDGAGTAVGSNYSSPGGVQRLLVWLLAPVAAESAEHRTLLVSDPRQAVSLLKLLRSRGGHELDPGEDELRLRSALEQAEVLLKRTTDLNDGLRSRMETGGATVGNCVALLENSR